ncbi:trypsin-like peptidase domain-containing protein [Variovorax sp. EBFNA2]|uniref:trypsin-like peptidase domain-containing protein n=1 Tax=Variovorax sp. EBFNA2 TaxID=3342097 RepID=UPI0029BFEE57|nr:trypsin-like peptidase domain-containing protein [Variovorax boronicumulans]WPG41385.1 trypsin-like peptidase domain-containing protein [Variovorax boronicumulans]
MTPLAPAAAPQRACDITPGTPSRVASRSISVVDISTLRIGRDESLESIELEIAPEHDFADRLAWPLAASARISQIRDLASGVIIDGDGLILTSAHVVTNVDEAQVLLHDGRRFTARVVGVDKRTDVGLLKIDATALPVAVIGDSSTLGVGDWVAAISSPFGFQGSLTAGVVSAVGRVMGGAGDIPFIQTDVAINPGSSGSPLFNSRGEVVGINSMIYSGSGGYMGLSFAVPINLAMGIAGQLREHGVVHRAYLGAQFQEMTPALAQSFELPSATGALVVRVEADSPAQAAGLAQGDAVLSLDGKPLARLADLPQQIAQRSPGSRVQLEVWRAGTRRLLQASLRTQPASPESRFAPAVSEWNDGLGLSLAELSPLQRVQLRIDSGLLVRESSGPARSEGIRAGDVVVALNMVNLYRVDDFARGLAQISPGGTVALLVLRDRRLAYVAVRLPAVRRDRS